MTPSFESEKYVWLKKRLSIDQVAIDEEVCEIPVLVQESAEFTALAIEIREAAKEDLDRSTAQIAETLRNSPEPGGRRRSETAIASSIPLSPVLAEKQKLLSEARLDSALWSSLTEALRRKDSALKTIAELIMSGMLTTSSIYQKRRKELRGEPQA